MGGLGNYLFQVSAGYSKSIDIGVDFFINPNNVQVVHNKHDIYLDNFFKKIPNFDMCMLGAALQGPCNDTIHPYIKHANGNVSGGSGYIISRSFGPMLIKNISDSSRLLEYVKMVSGHIVTVYCHDIYWRGIQIGTSWYVLNPILGVQRESYSDIAEVIVNKM
jgi:hypothetical protein